MHNALARVLCSAQQQHVPSHACASQKLREWRSGTGCLGMFMTRAGRQMCDCARGCAMRARVTRCTLLLRLISVALMRPHRRATDQRLYRMLGLGPATTGLE